MGTLAQDHITNSQVPKGQTLPDMGTLSEGERNELFRRRALLGELADKERVSNALLTRRAQEVGVSSRTLRRYHTSFRRAGLMGLAPGISGTPGTSSRASQRGNSRSGGKGVQGIQGGGGEQGGQGGQGGQGRKGTHYIITPHMVEIVRSLRLTHRDASVRHIYELAAQHASKTGGKVPSMFQVRSICAQIPAPVRLLADGREGEFRNRYRITYPIRHDPHRVIWQIDHKAPLHMLVRDMRAPSHHTASGVVRPFLTMVVDSASRLVMTGLFSYDEPNRFTVAAAIRDALLMSEHKPFGGVPDEIWIDNGKDLVAHHVYQLAEGLGIKLVPGPPHEPQVRGIVERLHETLDTRLWSTLPGYVGPNTVERNPKARAELTLSQLDEQFRAFIDRYHHEVHSEIGHTPLEFWQDHATPLPVDEPLLHLLDMLLKEPATRRVLKEGIKYAGERYWHPELAILVGEYVLVRAAPHYTAPEEIEVFFEGKWCCTAFSVGSPQGQGLERQVVVEAQRRQRAHARSHIKAAHDIYETIQLRSPSLPAQSVSSTSFTSSTSSTSSASISKHQGKRQPTCALDALTTPPPLSVSQATHQPDLFDFLAACRREGFPGAYDTITVCLDNSVQ